MKRLTIVFVALLLAIVVFAAYGCGGGQAQAQQGGAQAPAAAPAPQGPSPEQQAAIARQEALEKSTPQLQITEQVLPHIYMLGTLSRKYVCFLAHNDSMFLECVNRGRFYAGEDK